MDGEEEFIEKAVEGLVLGFFNQGEVCTCPSRALIHESIYEPFMARVMEKVAQIRRGDPLDTDTMIGAQASRQQFDKILSYIQIAREEGGQILTGGERAAIAPALDNGFYIQPTLIKGRNDMRSFQEEIFGPVIRVTTFKDEAEALAIANETQFGLGAGVWTRDTNLAYRMGRGIKAGRVWTNCYHVYPAHAAFGGYKQSGVGRKRTRWRWMPISKPKPAGELRHRAAGPVLKSISFLTDPQSAIHSGCGFFNFKITIRRGWLFCRRQRPCIYVTYVLAFT